MSQAKLLYELLSRGQDTFMIVEVAATIIANLELMLAKERKRKEKAHALPDDWTLPDEGRSYAKALGWPDWHVDKEAKHMADWAKANGILRTDWAAQWRNWCTSSYRKVSTTSDGLPGAQRPSDLRIQRKERMSDAIRQLALFPDVQQGARDQSGATNVVGFPGPSSKRS